MTPSGDPERTRASISGIAQGLDSCLAACADPERHSGFNTGVSAWSVVEHLEHLMRVDQSIFDWIVAATAQANPTERAETPNTIGAHILKTGVIPRGKGPAPTQTVPSAATLSEIVDGLGQLRGLAEELQTDVETIDACRATRPHHVLGHFTPSEWLRFLHVHHDHHAEIIEDILA